jgi:hypothetical protein
MRAATWLIWTSVVVASASSATALLGGAIVIHSAPAGGSARYEIRDGYEGRFKVTFEVEKPDGSRVELPPQVIDLPLNPPSQILEGPTLPTDAGGGTLKIRLSDVESGSQVKTSSSPIGF